jgi:hypothetical protein
MAPTSPLTIDVSVVSDEALQTTIFQHIERLWMMKMAWVNATPNACAEISIRFVNELVSVAIHVQHHFN